MKKRIWAEILVFFDFWLNDDVDFYRDCLCNLWIKRKRKKEVLKRRIRVWKLMECHEGFYERKKYGNEANSVS